MTMDILKSTYLDSIIRGIKTKKWVIGSNSTIISPVVIKSDAIIGAGSVVNEVILSGDTVAGKPARSLKN